MCVVCGDIPLTTSVDSTYLSLVFPSWKQQQQQQLVVNMEDLFMITTSGN